MSTICYCYSTSRSYQGQHDKAWKPLQARGVSFFDESVILMCFETSTGESFHIDTFCRVFGPSEGAFRMGFALAPESSVAAPLPLREMLLVLQGFERYRSQN